MKQKRMMLMLGGVLVVLIGCYVGLKAWNDTSRSRLRRTRKRRRSDWWRRKD